MSQPYIPAQPPPFEPQHTGPKRRRWPKPVAIFAAAIVLGFVAFSAGMVFGEETGYDAAIDDVKAEAGDTRPGLANSDEPTTSKPDDVRNTAPPVVEEPEPYFPDVDDFELSVVTLEKECFGSAGCNVTYEVELGYDGPDLDPSTTYQVIYEVRGGEDGPQINTLTVTGDEYEYDVEEYIGTSSSGVELTAVVTSVR